MEQIDRIKMDTESIFRLVREIRIKQEMHEKKLDRIELKLNKIGERK
jgi:hypothetical protein